MPSILIEIACPLCGSSDSRHMFAARDWAFGITDDQFGVRRCISCSCAFLSPRPTIDKVAQYYPPTYYWSLEGTTGDLSWDELVSRRQIQLEAKAATLAGFVPGKLLDIGAMKGEFLWYMRSRGWGVEGVELDNAVPNPQNMSIRHGDFLEMHFEDASYDVITLWAVLEHVYEPARFMKKVARLLKPGGRCVAVVSNFNSLQARYFRADDYPRHLTYFTKKSVRRLAKAHGLDAERFWTDQKMYGATLNGMFVYLLKRIGGYSADETFAEWRQLEHKMLFYGEWRGKPSTFVLNVSRFDRAVSLIPEKILDALGLGFNLGFVLYKPA